jgi:AcrR family transcriptional regulator
MPRPRFEKLDSELRRRILASATEEFAEHGFEGASYNRIIERSGLSKGAMYYYFDDKHDLFVTTLTDAFRRLIVETGSVEAAHTAAEFWQEVRAWYRRSLQLCQDDPATIGLIRSLMKSVERGNGSVALTELRRLGRGYLDDFIRRGQELNAVRSDLPDGLLTSILMALEEGIDLWLADQIDTLDGAEMDAIAETVTAVYRGVAAPAGAQSSVEMQMSRNTRLQSAKKGKKR